MATLREWVTRLWGSLRPRRRDADLEEELRLHLEMAAEHERRQATSREEAVRSAVIQSGGIAQSMEALRDQRGLPWVEELSRDTGLACRRLVRTPAMAAAVVATLTVGLGMFAVVYTVVQKILIEPMPYKDPDNLYFVWRDYRAYLDLSRGFLGGPDIAELQEAGGVIEDASGLTRQFRTFSMREGQEPTEIAVMVTWPNLFELLGVEPAMGRGFVRSEVGPGRPPVIVLTHDFWTRLGADPAILGTSVRLNGQPFTVIGVLPPRFAFMRNASVGPPERADAYITFADITNLAEENPTAGIFAGVMRARRGTSPEVVASAVDAVGKAIDARYFNGRGLKLYPIGLKPDLIAPIRPALVVVGFAGVFLLLALIVNLASVLLARAAQREHEFAVSRALGANSAAVVRATLLEGVLLGLAGGAAGALVATWAIRTLVALAPLDLPRREAVVLDMRIAAVIVGVGVLLGLLAAIVPAAWAARTSLSSLLANSGVRGGGGGHGRMRHGLVIAQVALSLVLLTTGGLVVRSVERLLRADPGFKTEGVLTMRIPMPLAFAREMKDVIALHDRIERALAAIPGVTGVSATSSLPLTANASQNSITISGAPGLTGDRDRDSPAVDVIGIRANYIEVMGIRVLAGRTFETARREGVREALIDRHLARQFFPTGSPVGAKIMLGRDQAGRELFGTIVGVVDHARQYNVHEDGRPQVYLRAEDGSRPFIWVLRSHGDPQSLMREARAAVRGTDPRLAVSEVRTMDEVVAVAVRQQRISAVLIASFALGALLLAAMGLFGVISGAVTRRAHEFAVRLALGADHGRVLRIVLGDGARLVAIGLLLGAPGIYFAGRIIRGVLVGVSPLDPLTLSAVVAGLALVAMVACYLPARRVLGLQPAQSLRQ